MEESQPMCKQLKEDTQTQPPPRTHVVFVVPHLIENYVLYLSANDCNSARLLNWEWNVVIKQKKKFILRKYRKLCGTSSGEEFIKFLHYWENQPSDYDEFISHLQWIVEECGNTAQMVFYLGILTGMNIDITEPDPILLGHYHKGIAFMGDCNNILPYNDGMDAILDGFCLGNQVKKIKEWYDSPCTTVERTDRARDVMRHSVIYGRESLVRLCHDEWGYVDVNNIMYWAARTGHIAIVRLCHDEWGADHVNFAMSLAAGHGHIDIVRLCHDEWGADNVDHAMAAAARTGHIEIVRLLS